MTSTPGIRQSRFGRSGVVLGAAVLLLGACSSGGSTAYRATSTALPQGGVVSHPTPSAAGAGASAKASGRAAAAGGSATAGAAKSAAKGGSTAAAGASQALRPKIGTTLPCNAQGLVVHLSQASGAVHGYLAKPGASGPTVVALDSRSARSTAARAASFAAAQLRTGLQSAQGCASTSALTDVASQTAGYLSTLSGRLSRNAATPPNVSAASALMDDVTSQSARNGLKITDRVPTTALLATS